MQKNILFVNLDKNWGGGQEYLLTLSQALSSKYNVFLLVKPKSISKERLTSALKDSNVLFLEVNFLSFKFYIDLVQIIWKSDYICIQREHDLWVALMTRVCSPLKKIFYFQQIEPRKFRFLVLFADKIIANSKFIQNLVNDKYSKFGKEISVMYPLCRDTVIPPDNKTKMLLKGKPKLLMSGAFYKQQHLFFPILRNLLNSLPEAHLTLISPNQKKELKENIISNITRLNLQESITIFEGLPRAEYLQLLNQADFFLYTFTKEPFGFAILESCQLKKFIICYKGGGVSEILEHYSKSSLIQPDDILGFENAIKINYENLSYQSNVDLTYFDKVFSFSQNIALYENLFS